MPGPPVCASSWSRGARSSSSPRSARLSEDGPAPPDALLRELDRRGVAYQLGRVVLGVTRGDEPAVRAALTAAGVSRDLVYNRGFLMLLPEGVDKGTGVRTVLRFFRLSFHDVLAFGDAENDLHLFGACGWSACPQDAEPAVRGSADWVFPGHDGDSVAAAISGPVLSGLPMQRSATAMGVRSARRRASRHSGG